MKNWFLIFTLFAIGCETSRPCWPTLPEEKSVAKFHEGQVVEFVLTGQKGMIYSVSTWGQPVYGVIYFTTLNEKKLESNTLEFELRAAESDLKDQTNELEFYEGFQKEVHSHGRFANSTPNENGYYPVKLIAKIPFENIKQKGFEALKEVLPKEEE